MADSLSNLARVTNDVIAAYDERTRLFNKLRNLNLTDEERKETIAEYKKAAKLFDELRSQLIK